MIHVTIVGRCQNCGYLLVTDDSADGSWKSVPSKKWLKDHGYSYTEKRSKQRWCVCDGCVNHWAVDLCACGSGEKIEDCECGCGEPSVILNGKLPVFQRF